MNIYAIKDRLIEYFMQPFAAPEDKAVLSSIARLVNTEDSNDPVAQAPHHYEIWRLGFVDEEGHIHAKREYLADASSLIRSGTRPQPAEAVHDRRAPPRSEPLKVPGTLDRLARSTQRAGELTGTEERPTAV